MGTVWSALVRSQHFICMLRFADLGGSAHLCRYHRSTWSVWRSFSDLSIAVATYSGSPQTWRPSGSGPPRAMPNFVARKMSFLLPDFWSLEHCGGEIRLLDQDDRTVD